MKELIAYMAKALVDNPDEVKVNENIDIHVNDGVISANITSKRKGVYNAPYW